MKIGILGAGQLGRMMALAGYPLGMTFRFFDPVADSPAGDLAELHVARFDDSHALEKFASGLDLVTYEFENVPVEAARFLQRYVPVHPAPEALEAAQDRLVEKNFFRDLGIPTPPYAAVSSREDLDAAVATIGLPTVLKTRRLGYDGKGQVVLREEADIARAWELLGRSPLILEGFVPFTRELSLLTARGRTGECAFYPLAQNEHRNGILWQSYAPELTVGEELQRQAEAYGRLVVEKLGYAGIHTIEFFDVAGRLVANEMAPRVHNSGHLTIEGSTTSQFENHLRAAAGLPLGSTAPRGFAGMVNLIGFLPRREDVLPINGAHYHLYGKEPRPGRKVGHITIVEQDVPILKGKMAAVRSLIPG